MRLRSDIWVAAYIRTCEANGAYAVVRRKGAEAAGVILIHLDRRDGTHVLFGPAPASLAEEAAFSRAFIRLHDSETIDETALEQRISRETAFDADVWIVAVEDRRGRHFLADQLKESR